MSAPAATHATPTEIEPALANLKFVQYENDSEQFDAKKINDVHNGPSPYAHTLTEGPSVLKSYAPKHVSGKLAKTYPYTEVTPGLGREYYEDARLVDILKDDELLRDLAITVSERGVVFFKNQHDLTLEQQKQLADRLGRLSGKPESSGLHIHPTAFAQGALSPDTNQADPEVLVLDSQRNAELYKKFSRRITGRRSGWHSDITFEPVPASYAVLRLSETPSSRTDTNGAQGKVGQIGGSGGDTLWASAYGLAEKISPRFLSFLEELTGEYSQPTFHAITEARDIPFYSAERGAPENIGSEITATHPLVRTNPVTGWKSILAIGEHFTSIHDLDPDESDTIRNYLLSVLNESPELQLRYKWSPLDVAIWDNRAVYHSIIPFAPVNGNRVGLRTLSVGERPFLDPNSKLRSEAIAGEPEATRA